MLAMFFPGLTLFTGLSWLWVIDQLGRYTLRGFDYGKAKGEVLIDYIQGQRARRERVAVVKEEVTKLEMREPVYIEPVIREVPSGDRVEKEKQTILEN